MKELHIDRFDALISLASAECVKEEADAFLAADISGIEDNPRMLRKILGASRHQKHKPLKIFLLVALLCMSIAFTACMLVPEIRHAIWNVLVRDHDDHVEIEFESGAVTETDTGETVTDYPDTIEQKLELTYLPTGCVKGEELLMSLQYHVYYYTETGELAFYITQSVITGSDSFVNSENDPSTKLKIDQVEAILIENNHKGLNYSLTWQDIKYRYTIYGSCKSKSELIKIAEGVILGD